LNGDHRQRNGGGCNTKRMMNGGHGILLRQVFLSIRETQEAPTRGHVQGRVLVHPGSLMRPSHSRGSSASKFRPSDGPIGRIPAALPGGRARRLPDSPGRRAAPSGRIRPPSRAARQAQGEARGSLRVRAGDRSRHVHQAQDRLSEERALLQLGRHEAEIEGLDVETLLNYAEYLALNPARLWQEAGPEQKARLQVFLVPSGLTWDGERFGTVESGLFFSRLARDSSSGGKMAPQVGFEPTTLRLTAGCSTAELLRNRR
jgi:hypothetical protein